MTTISLLSEYSKSCYYKICFIIGDLMSAVQGSSIKDSIIYSSEGGMGL